MNRVFSKIRNQNQTSPLWAIYMIIASSYKGPTSAISTCPSSLTNHTLPNWMLFTTWVWPGLLVYNMKLILLLHDLWKEPQVPGWKQHSKLFSFSGGTLLVSMASLLCQQFPSWDFYFLHLCAHMYSCVCECMCEYVCAWVHVCVYVYECVFMRAWSYWVTHSSLKFSRFSSTCFYSPYASCPLL